MTPIEAEKIMAYIEDDGLDYRLILRAIEIAVCNGNRNLNYIEGILKKWREANIFAIEALEVSQRNLQEKKVKRIGGETNGSRANSKTEGSKTSERYKPTEPKYEELERLRTMSDEELNKWMAENGIF